MAEAVEDANTGRMVFTFVISSSIAILGVTLVYPFLITLSSSTSTAMDFQRYSPIPRSIFSRKDRFVRGLVPYFHPLLRNCMDELAMSFTDVPPTWATWP